LSVPVTVCVVPDVVLVVKVTVATPLAFVVDVGLPNEPPFVLDHVTTLPDVPTALLFASASCAVIVTPAPAIGLELDDVTRYLVAVLGTVVTVTFPVLPPVVAVITCAVPVVALVVKLIVATPAPSVFDVAALKFPPFVADQVTTWPDVDTALLLASASCAVIVTVLPAAGFALDVETRYLVAAPTTVVMVGDVPLTPVLSVPVTVVAVPLTVCVVNVTAAVPLAFVVDVAAENEPFAFDLVQVTTRPASETLLLFASRNWAVMVTPAPATGLGLLVVTR